MHVSVELLRSGRMGSVVSATVARNPVDGDSSSLTVLLRGQYFAVLRSHAATEVAGIPLWTSR